MEELLEYLARQLVDSPDEVRVERSERDTGEVLLELHVAEADRGKVIGKGGRIARSPADGGEGIRGAHGPPGACRDRSLTAAGDPTGSRSGGSASRTAWTDRSR